MNRLSELRQDIHMLRARRVGIDSCREPVIYIRADSSICRSEGFEAHCRIRIERRGRGVEATLNIVTDAHGLFPGEAGLSEAAWHLLQPAEGEVLALSHPAPPDSLKQVRAKLYGRRLEDDEIGAVLRDVARGRYSHLHLSALVAACAGSRLDLAETLGLTRAMMAVGKRLSWSDPVIADKHCVGGLPGNRTSLIVVPIVAAFGLPIPKTSARAITSSAGTADTMETLAPVNLDLPAMRRVVEREGGCIVRGGAASLSPVDDILNRIGSALDLDSEGLLVASVLSKKAAAGATHVVIDIPMGPTAKVRSVDVSRALADRFTAVGAALGLRVRVVITDGTQPVGRGIGPALEARDALAVLRHEPAAPQDLRERALVLAGELLELSGRVPREGGYHVAKSILAEGRAWSKFQAICEAQGGMREPQQAPYTHVVPAQRAGPVAAVDNRRLAQVAKLAGAPRAATAGVVFHAPLGAVVAPGEPLFTIHAEAPGELAHALAYLTAQADDIVTVASPA